MSTQITITKVLPYKSYVAILDQRDTLISSIELENTIGPVIWEEIIDGSCKLVLNNAFPFDKTYCPNIVINSAPEFFTNNGGSNNFIEFNIPNGATLQGTKIEIRVYNSDTINQVINIGTDPDQLPIGPGQLPIFNTAI